ncbi:hypothetical protein, partial [Alkalihalobacillus sp. BA299]|uniref:hypothetical protein n=1 Tax=Alkalihalobacillus sp. BA299 TaxID=2815938 RepID=UPI001ADA8F2C
MYQPKQISIESVRNNENAPTVIPRFNVSNASISPNIYFFILEDYHDYVYLITHHLNFMLKAQFRKVFDISESAARHRFKKLLKDDDLSYRNEEEARKNKEYYILGKKRYKGSDCIFPISRTFTYAQINFPNEKQKRLDYDPNEVTMLRGIMKTEYWLRFGELMIDELNFLPEHLPKELLRKKPFEYNHTAFFCLINKLDKEKTEKGYAEFTEKAKYSKLFIDKELPEVDIEEEDEKVKKERIKKYGVNDFGTQFGLDPGERHQLERENELNYRFKKVSEDTKRQYVSAINRAAFETLLKSDVYVTKVKELKHEKAHEPQFEYHIVILHLPTNGPGRYNRIITALQTITCYQNISTKLNITVVAHSKK